MELKALHLEVVLGILSVMVLLGYVSNEASTSSATTSLKHSMQMDYEADQSDDDWPCTDVSGILALIAGYDLVPKGVACHIFNDQGDLTDLHQNNPEFALDDLRTNVKTHMVSMMTGLREGWIFYSDVLEETQDQYVDCCANIEDCLCEAAGTCEDEGAAICNAFFYNSEKMMDCYNGADAECYTCVQDAITKCEEHDAKTSE